MVYWVSSLVVLSIPWLSRPSSFFWSPSCTSWALISPCNRCSSSSWVLLSSLRCFSKSLRLVVKSADRPFRVSMMSPRWPLKSFTGTLLAWWAATAAITTFLALALTFTAGLLAITWATSTSAGPATPSMSPVDWADTFACRCCSSFTAALRPKTLAVRFLWVAWKTSVLFAQSSVSVSMSSRAVSRSVMVVLMSWTMVSRSEMKLESSEFRLVISLSPSAMALDFSAVFSLQKHAYSL
mmetsp:Transcript_34915/g.84326  ORF Transcript_34915/g.84326 Transcript_34915/m.84326 type:complete len:239 (-) Transcript_34915:289-1005(-)